MYIEPTWLELLIRGSLLHIASILIIILITAIIAKTVNKTVKKPNKEDATIITIIICIVAFSSIMLFADDYIWNTWMEQPSVREEVITIDAIQPRPGAVKMNESGYSISNSNQLIFVTKEGKEFANCENWPFGKFETRTIFNKLRINGTYKIKYYGWRNGQNNEFPNILSVEEVINENNTQPNDFNKYFGAHKGNKAYDIEFEE